MVDSCFDIRTAGDFYEYIFPQTTIPAKNNKLIGTRHDRMYGEL